MKLNIAIVFALISFGAEAKNLGQFGHSYPVQEQSMLEFIHDRLNTLDGDGSLEKVNNDFIKRVQKHVNNPAPLNLSRTNKTSTHLYSPSVTLKSDLKDHLGNVIAYKGVEVNALSRLPSYAPYWIFFNADDEAQVKWAKKQISDHVQVKIILTGGAIKKSENIFNQAIYFDQESKISTKLSIEHVPARVQRKGNFLEITQFAVKGAR